jgi:hypothetical protein
VHTLSVDTPAVAGSANRPPGTGSYEHPSVVIIRVVKRLPARLWPFSVDDGESGGDDEGPVRAWDVVPGWQYDGWASQTGGLAVEEQEAALEEVQRRAEAIEEEAVDGERIE